MPSREEHTERWYDAPVEADSEGRRRGPGRPPVFPENLYDEIDTPQQPLSRRQQMNRLYANRALHWIDNRHGDDERAAYFFGTRTPRWGVLAELGRALDRLEGNEREDQFWEMFTWLLRERPRAKDAEAEIRRFRTGQRPPARTERLVDELARSITSYRRRHPDLSRDQEIAALRELLAERGAHTEEDRTSGASLDPERR
jgi:hypothetical protein